ncbi:MAG: hypothetical protein U0326_28075 [Polyangiales bacterium]
MTPRTPPPRPFHVQPCRVVVALFATALLPACGLARSVNGGLFAQPGAGDHAPVGGIAAGHLGWGRFAYLGIDGTMRVTDAYAHGAAGAHVSVITQSAPVGPYARVGFAPLGVSARDGNVWYAMDTSLEVGLQIPFGEQTHTQGFLSARDVGQALTIGLRGDIEYRPAQDYADYFVSLVVGYHDYNLH